MSNIPNLDSGNPKRCLVLGGLGFIGSHLVDALLQAGYLVRCFDRPHVAPGGFRHMDVPNYELFEGDFVNEADVSAALEGCDVCYHLVLTTLPKSSNVNPIFDVESNVIGTVRLLTHALKSGLKKVIFVSSGGTIYGSPQHVPIEETHPTDPVCSYGITKLTIEKYLGLFKQLHGLDCAILRIANPYGERQRTHASQGAIAVFLDKALRGEPVEIWGDGSVVRDYIYISDVIDALLSVINHTGERHVFNIGSGRGHSLNEVLGYIESETGRTIERRYLPSRSFDVPVNVLSIKRAQHDLNWSPKLGLDQGLRRFAHWLREHP